VLCEARWANETDRFEPNEIIMRYQNAISLASEYVFNSDVVNVELTSRSESPYYHLGHYYDALSTVPAQMYVFSDFICQMELTSRAQYHYHTVQNYLSALKFGVKYIYRTMPRLLTIWLDLGENSALHASYVPIHLYPSREAD
jgi:serine/threonine-protein kinase ATR